MHKDINVRIYSSDEVESIKQSIGGYLDDITNKHFGNGDMYSNELSNAINDEFIITNTRTAEDAVYSTMVSALNKANLNRPGILSRNGIYDVEKEAEKMAEEAVRNAEAKLRPQKREEGVYTQTDTFLFHKNDIAAWTDNYGGTLVVRIEEDVKDRNRIPYVSVKNGYGETRQEYRNTDGSTWRMATEDERLGFIADERRALLRKITDDISNQIINQKCDKREAAILKEGAACFIEKYNSDYYQTKNIDVRRLLDGSDVTDLQSLVVAVASIIYDIHSEALARDPGIFDRLLPQGMDRCDEVLNASFETLDAAAEVLYAHVNNVGTRMDKGLKELNSILPLYDEMQMTKDPEYSFHSHAKSYWVKSFDDGMYSLMANDGIKDDYMSPKITAREVLARIEGRREEIQKELGGIEKEIDNTVTKNHPDFTKEQKHTFTLGFIAGKTSQEMKQAETLSKTNPRLTDIQVILPVSKEYYIKAKVDGRGMIRMPITREEVKAMTEGELDVHKVAEKYYARQLEMGEKKGNVLHR